MKTASYLLLIVLMSDVSFPIYGQEKSSLAGEWKIIKQKITYPDGKVVTGDSSNVFTRKIITPTNFVVIGEQLIQGKKQVRFVAGGRYTLIGDKYSEKNEYASYPDYDKLQVDYTVKVEGDLMTQNGIVTNPNGSRVSYEEIYQRQK